MAQSFSTTESQILESFVEPETMQNSNPARRRVLVTGADGNIGSYFAARSHEKYELILMDRNFNKNGAELAQFGQLVEGDIGDLERLKVLFAGVDTILHLAGNPSPIATWQSLLEVNIAGTYNVFVAAKACGCRRVVYASSIHAVSGYPEGVQVKTSEPVNPGDLYGVSKCFGEAMGRYMATQENLSTIAIRIGAFQPRKSVKSKKGVALLDAWVSRRDLNQLFEKSIDAEKLQFAIFHGLSDNHFKRLDISDARELIGYAPQDDSMRENPDLQSLRLDKRVTLHNQSDGQESGLRQDLE